MTTQGLQAMRLQLQNQQALARRRALRVHLSGICHACGVQHNIMRDLSKTTMTGAI